MPKSLPYWVSREVVLKLSVNGTAAVWTHSQRSFGVLLIDNLTRNLTASQNPAIRMCLTRCIGTWRDVWRVCILFLWSWSKRLLYLKNISSKLTVWLARYRESDSLFCKRICLYISFLLTRRLKESPSAKIIFFLPLYVNFSGLKFC